MQADDERALIAGVEAGVLTQVDAQTLHGEVAKLEFVQLRFRAVAPETAQRAALCVYRGAYAGAVVYGVALYIVYTAGCIFIFQSNETTFSFSYVFILL